jgi:WD40 repeat protein
VTSHPPAEPAPREDAPDEPPRLAAHASGSGGVFQAGRDQHLHFADGASAATRVRGETVADVCPYPGLAAFGPDQERWFFGRDRAVGSLCQRLDAKLAGTGPLILIGPSGAGKSSLLRAGLIPALDQGRLPAAGSRSWPRALLAPTAHPVLALATELSPVTGGEAEALAGSWLASPEECVTSVRRALAGVPAGPAGPGAPARAVILVDQFEEAFTLCADEGQRQVFIDLLDRLAARPADGAEPAALVLICVRADFYDACVRHRALRAALKASPVLLDPMSAAELRQAILFPAQDVGLDIEPGLIEVLLRDAGVTGDGAADEPGYQAGRLPLLAHALRATWTQHEGHRLTVHGYQLTGGIRNAIATSADEMFTGLDEAGQQAARALFLRLVKVGDGTEDVCRRVSRAELARDIPGGPAGAVLGAFTQARLLTQDQDTVSITHEVLLRAWPRLRGWLDADRAGNLIRQDLETAASTWDRDQRAPEGLYRGSRLDAARTWARGHDADLTGTGRDFLAASARQQHRASRLRRTAVAALAVLTVIAITTSAVALWQRGSAVQQGAAAVQQRDQAVYNQTVAEALQFSGSNPALAAQLDIAAAHMKPGLASLSRLVSTENTPLPARLTAGASQINAVAFSPSSKIMASGSFNGAIRLWDVADPVHARVLGQPLTVPFYSLRAVVTGLAFSPDGRMLAAATWVGMGLWDVADPAHPRALGPLPLPGARVILLDTVAFSPDGRVLAAGGTDGTILLWDVADPAHPRLLGRVQNAGAVQVNSVAFSPDGRMLADGDFDGMVRLWDVADPAHPRLLGRVQNAGAVQVNSVAFSPDGRVLASGDGDGTIRRWDVADPAHPQVLGEQLTSSPNSIKSVAFSPDGMELAAGGGDGAIRLWDVADPAQPELLGQPLTASSASVTSVAFAPNGRTLAGGGYNGTIQLWNLPRTVLTGPVGGVTSVAFSPSGQVLAAGDGAGGLQLWDVPQTGPPRRATGPALPSNGQGVTSVALSSDGRLMAIGGEDGTVWLWTSTDPGRYQLLGSQAGQEPGDVASVAFSPYGHTLVSVRTTGRYATGEILEWNVADPAHPRALGKPVINGFGIDSEAFSPGGRILATGNNDGEVQLWDLADPGHPRLLGRALTGGAYTIDSMAFSADGRTLASGSNDGTIRVWDVADPARPRPRGPAFSAGYSADAVAFSPDGRTLAVGVADGTVLLWHLTGPAPLQRPSQSISASSDAVDALAFSPDGRTLASGSSDGAVRLWPLSAGYASTQICRSTPELTRQQWDRYVSASLPYRPTC